MGSMGIHANCSRFCGGFIQFKLRWLVRLLYLYTLVSTPAIFKRFRLTWLVHLLLHLSHFVIILQFARSVGDVSNSSWNTCVCYLSCIVTDAVWSLRWLLCFMLSVTSSEDGNRYSPKQCVALCVVTMQQTVTYTLNDTTYVKLCQKSTRFTRNILFDVIWCGNPQSCKHSLTWSGSYLKVTLASNGDATCR
jgi:hypothetical protein